MNYTTVLCSLCMLALAACNSRGAAIVDTNGDGAAVVRRVGAVARLELAARPSHIDSGQVLNVRVRLVNTAGHALWVNKRLALNDEHIPQVFREVWLRVRG